MGVETHRDRSRRRARGVLHVAAVAVLTAALAGSLVSLVRGETTVSLTGSWVNSQSKSSPAWSLFESPER